MELVEVNEKGAPKTKVAQGKVRVKVMAFVMQFKPGDIVDCEPDVAKNLCKVSERDDGSQLLKVVRAMRIEDAEKLEHEKANPKDIANMSAGELAATGRKNIVQTPKDEAFEKNLALAKKASDKAAKEAAAAAKAKADAAKEHDEAQKAGE